MDRDFSGLTDSGRHSVSVIWTAIGLTLLTSHSFCMRDIDRVLMDIGLSTVYATWTVTDFMSLSKGIVLSL